jgi:hypothetical protein
MRQVGSISFWFAIDSDSDGDLREIELYGNKPSQNGTIRPEVHVRTIYARYRGVQGSHILAAMRSERSQRCDLDQYGKAWKPSVSLCVESIAI